MSRVDGCGTPRPAAPLPTEPALRGDALRRRFEDCLGEARARTAPRTEGARPTTDATREPARTDAARGEPTRSDAADRSGDTRRSGDAHRSGDADPSVRDAARDEAAARARAAGARGAEIASGPGARGLDGPDGAGGDGTDPSAATPGLVPAAVGAPRGDTLAATAGPATTDTESPAGPAPGQGAVDGVARRGGRAPAAAAEADTAAAPIVESSAPAPSPFAAFVARAEAARPASDAAALAQWLIDRLPLSDPADRSVTLTFPGGSAPVERIVLAREGGVLNLAVQARPEAAERVRDALRVLEDRLRQRGLKVGSVRLG